ncbi:hypothetical protein RSSM_03908 [Rhodopirellula sallentina SM41]|uniref:Uncharacterized protein n=1 Tax=Rhodopirellula sallentina SM41 TaxID=1263870 RepID=M5U9W5_9BACT|nr:hypothetical protein RSSM_03908 [Rhodopirellula sallentina SM41]
MLTPFANPTSGRAGESPSAGDAAKRGGGHFLAWSGHMTGVPTCVIATSK